MFRKFTKEENVSSQTQVKSSVARGIRNSVLEQMPQLEKVIDDIFPKKENVIVVKCSNYMDMVIVSNEILFFHERDKAYYPTLRLLHKYPFILPSVQVDRGAIKFVMQGANIMCPGLTSAGGKIDEELKTDTIVAIMAEGKQSPLAIGVLKMSGKEIKEVNKGIGIDNIHYIGDGLWKLQLD